ncbi:MAG TPA: hypothetical protein VGR37_10060 [Longimicrobiaceae bacterium]|nr:hypothetical protein [Longimicrobiaceae bacterium]
MNAINPKVRIRMYRQGLGDCFLVTFYPEGGPVHMLIDCGSLGATTTGVKMAAVADDIGNETGDHLHLLVATHEHKDHVSGFRSERERFDELTVDRVWVAWTENPKDELAREVSKYKADLLSSVALAEQALARSGVRITDMEQPLAAVRSGVRELLGFFGDVPTQGAPFAADFAETVHEAMTYVTGRAGKDVDFLSPGEVIEPSWLPGVRFYVLGPPRDKTALRNMGKHGSPELYGATAESIHTAAAGLAFSASVQAFPDYRASLEGEQREMFEQRLPFDARFRIEARDKARCRERFGSYYDEKNAWRQIDADWLATTSELALQLDSYTNNTSLVLAIELIADGRVLLFPADAQLGNWLSWHDYTWKVKEADGALREVTARDLLHRTVFYKVGHHASHNATATESGLELMQRDDLVAMIPLDRSVAIKKRPPWQMPAKALYRRLLEKTRGRVLRSDTGWPTAEERPSTISQAEWDEARQSIDVGVDNLYIDFRLR